MLQDLPVRPESQQVAHIVHRIAGDDDRSQPLVRPWQSPTTQSQAHLRNQEFNCSVNTLGRIWPDVSPRSMVTLRSHLLECACPWPLTLYTSRWLWMPAPGPLVCPAQLGVQDMICVSGRMTWITLTSRSCLPTSSSAGDAVWDNLDICPRTQPTGDSCLCTYTNWFDRPAGPFLCAACSAYCASEWAVTSCPGTLDAGFVCQDYRFCTSCQQGVLRDAEHLGHEHCRICVIGVRTCFKHLKVMP